MTQFIEQNQLDETLKVARALYTYRRLFQEGENHTSQFVESVAALLHMITTEPWKSMTETDFLDHISKAAPRPQA